MPAPNIPFRRLPAGMMAASRDETTGEITYYPKSEQYRQPINVRRYSNDQLKQSQDHIKQQYSVQWEMLRKTSRNEKQFKRGVDELIAKTDSSLNELGFAHEQQTETLDQIQRLVEQGALTSEAGQQAMQRLVLPRETAGALAPAKTGQPLSMSQIMGSISDSIVEFAESAPDIPGFEWGPPKKTKEDLVDRYVQWRRQIGYDSFDPVRRNQLDQRWDSYMLGSTAFDNWWVDKKKRKLLTEVLATRTNGKIGRAMRGRIGRTPTSTFENPTPVGGSIAKDKSQMLRLLTPAPYVPKAATSQRPTPRELRQRGTEEAYTTGIKLGYWQ